MIHNRTAEENRQQLHRSLHLTDYFAILREHKWLAVIPFALILAGSVGLTLFATPVYTAEAMVEIDTQSGAQGFVQELQFIETAAQVETEMEIMRSRRVAERAAEMLLQRGLSDFLRETNAYRPLEVLLRAVGYGRPDCAVEIRSEPPPPGAPGAETFLFRFARDNGGGVYALDVEKVKERRFRTEVERESVEARAGEPFTAFGHVFSLAVEGDPVGREYEMTVRSKANLTDWVRGRISVSQVRRNTGLVALGVKASTPRLAKEAAAAIAESYVDTKRAKKVDEAGRAIDFLKRQVDMTKQGLDDVEKSFDDFRSVHGVTLLSERTHLLIDRISAL